MNGRILKKIGSSASISRVPFLLRHYWHESLLPFIYCASRLAPLAFYPPSSLWSDGTPSNDGIHELAAPRWHSPTITRRLVVSYTTFSPLPRTSTAVTFFCRHLPSPTASTFGSGVPFAARTFLSCDLRSSGRTEALLPIKMQSYALL